MSGSCSAPQRNRSPQLCMKARQAFYLDGFATAIIARTHEMVLL